MHNITSQKLNNSLLPVIPRLLGLFRGLWEGCPGPWLPPDPCCLDQRQWMPPDTEGCVPLPGFSRCCSCRGVMWCRHSDEKLTTKLSYIWYIAPMTDKYTRTDRPRMLFLLLSILERANSPEISAMMVRGWGRVTPDIQISRCWSLVSVSHTRCCAEKRTRMYIPFPLYSISFFYVSGAKVFIGKILGWAWVWRYFSNFYGYVGKFCLWVR